LHAKKQLLSEIEDLLATSIKAINGLSKPCSKFVSNLYILWLSLQGRCNFTTLASYGGYSEKSYRLHFENNQFDFTSFNSLLVDRCFGPERIAAFDPSFLKKSGKSTFGLDYFYNGSAQRTEKGIEIGCLAIIDVEVGTALPLSIKQTPKHKEHGGLIEHYSGFIESNSSIIKSCGISCIAVDGFFAKKKFIDKMVDIEFVVITKLRLDANLKYCFKGKQKQGRGRKRVYAEKIDCKNIDTRRIKKIHTDELNTYYSDIVYAVSLKRLVRMVYIQDNSTGKYTILISSDKEMDAMKIAQYYRLRFQIEFLFRDAKGFGGLQDCEARSEAKINFHHNMAFSSVALAKAASLRLCKEKNDFSFSIRNIKTHLNNKLMADLIFSNLGLDMSCKKIIKLYKKCLNFGARAA
jgi:hypothetical protein